MQTAPASEQTDLLERFLPVYDVSDSVAVTVDADRATTWKALLDADLIDVGRRKPMVAALGAARMLPQLLADGLRGHGLPEKPDTLRLGELAGESSAQGVGSCSASVRRRSSRSASSVAFGGR